MSGFYRGTGGCSQVYSPYCRALENDCQFCGPRSMGASCANWNGQVLFGNSCCAKRLRQATETTLLKRKSFSKRIAEEEAKDELKTKKKKKGRKNSQDLEIMFKALENYCDPKKCKDCQGECRKCGNPDGTKAGQKKSATSIKPCSSKTSRVLPSEVANTKKPNENREETNKEKTKTETKKQFNSTQDTKDKSGALANSAKPGKYENPITTKANENKEATKVTPQPRRSKLENPEASKISKQLKPEATEINTERKQFNEFEICDILTDLLVKKFKAIDYTKKMLSSKKYPPSTSLCCSKCTCDEGCLCLDSTDFSDVESKIGTAIGALISENLSKGKNIAQKTSAQKENDHKKLKTPKEPLPIGTSPMAAINPRRAKERSVQKMLVDASTSMSDSKDSSPIDKLINELNEMEEEETQCCKSSSKGYWSEIDDDLSDPGLKKKKKAKGGKKLRPKDARGSFGSKRSSTESKVNKRSPTELRSGSRFKEGCNRNTCTSRECSARKLSKPMIEILTYASNLNVERSNKSSRAGSPDRDTTESTAQDMCKGKCNRASQAVSQIESVLEDYDSRSPSRGSTSTSQIEEHASHNARLQSTKTRSPDRISILKSSDKKTSTSASDIRASDSSAAKRQFDNKKSVTSPNGRKPTTSPDSRKPTTSAESRKPTTSPETTSAESRKPTTSADSRKPTTSPDSRKPTKSPDSRKPTTSPETTSAESRKHTTSPDSRKPTTSPESRKPTTSAESRKPITSPDTTSAESRKPTTSADSRKPTTSPDSRKPTKSPDSRKPTTSPETTSAESRKHTTSPDSRKPTTSPDSRKPTTSADGRKPTTSPDSRKPTISPDRRKPTISPDNEKSIRSPDNRKYITSDKTQSPDRIPSFRFPDKKQTISTDKRQSSTSPDNCRCVKTPDQISGSSRLHQGCNKNSCTSKVCSAKNRSLRAELSRIESPVQDGYDSRSPSRGSTSTSQIEEHKSDNARSPSTKARSPNSVPSVKSSDRKPSVSAPDIRASARSATKTQSKTSDKKQSVTSPDSRKPTTSPDTRKPTTSPDSRKPTTSAESRTPTTSADSRKPTTSSDSRKPTTSPDNRPSSPSNKSQSPDNKSCIRFPDQKQTISSDKIQSTISPDQISSSKRQNEGCNNSCSRKEKPAQYVNKSPRSESPVMAPEQSTPKDLPIKKRARASQTEPTNEMCQRNCSMAPQKERTAPIIASSSSETRSSDNIPSVRTPHKKTTRRSPAKRSSIKSPTKTLSVKSPDKKPSVRSPDKKPSIKSAAKKRSSPRQRESCCIETCTSKECAIKKSSQVESSAKEITPKHLIRGKSARSPPTLSPDESLRKDRNSRTPTASPSVSPVETNARPGHNMRSTDNKKTVSSPDKKMTVNTSGKTAAARASDKKPAKSSPLNKISNTSPEKSYSSSSPHILSSSSRLAADLISSTKKTFAKNCSCECQKLSRSKTCAEELNDSPEDEASNENASKECSIQKRTVHSQTPSLNESPLGDTDDSRIPTENTREAILPGNNLCQCDTDETGESSENPFEMCRQMDVQPSEKSALKANFNEESPTVGSRPSKTKIMYKSLSEKDVSLRREEMRMASFSANEHCICDLKRTDDDSSMPCPLRNPNCVCSRLQNEEDPMKAPVFDRCLCGSYPANYHPCCTKGNRCPCNDENRSEAYSSHKNSSDLDDSSPTENEVYPYNAHNNGACQCIYEAPNSREISPHDANPNLFAFIDTETDDSNTSDANANNFEVEKPSAAPNNCSFPAQRDERRAECNSALAAFRKLQECFSDFDLEGECFKKLENYAEFHSDVFGPSCLCDQNLKSNSSDKKRNSKVLSPDEKENVKPQLKNKQNKSKKYEGKKY